MALGVTDLTGNVAPVVIDSGPAGVGGVINVPFVSVTLCTPGTSTCQTIDHVLLDTGSYGLRIIAPGVLDPALALPAVTGPGGNPVGECAPFVSFVLWGSVHLADVKIAGETASSLPVQLAGDAAFAGAPSGCNATPATVAALGANGVLGVGLFDRDCGAPCTTQANNGNYYECTSTSCTGTVMPLASQVANPVAAFATDNNGIVLTMPAVPQGGASTLTGTLIFGIDTQANNQIGSSATVYAADSNGNFTTTYNNVQLNTSFLDSGSNGLFFSDSTIPQCSASSGFSGFYCPNAALPVSAVNTSRQRRRLRPRQRHHRQSAGARPQHQSRRYRRQRRPRFPHHLRLGHAVLFRAHGVCGLQRRQHRARHWALLGVLAPARIGAVHNQLRFFRLSCRR